MALKPVYKAHVVKKRSKPFVRFESDRHKRVQVFLESSVIIPEGELLDHTVCVLPA